MTSKWMSFLAVVIFALGFFASLAQAAEEKKDIFDVPKVVAVQNRKYFLNKGVTLNLGYLPTDSFTKGLALGGTYTHYFSDFTAWEIVNLNYVVNMKTDLQNQLQGFGVQPTRVPAFPQYYLTSNIVYTPFYNKSLLFNKTVVWGETSFLAGAGVAYYGRDTGNPEDDPGITPMISGGLNLRYFLSESTSLKLDIREHIAFVGGTDGVQAVLYIGMGYTFQLGDNKQATATTKAIEGDDLEKSF